MNKFGVEVGVHTGDARNIGTDMLVLKHMRNADGVGKAIARTMEVKHLEESNPLPDVGESKVFDELPEESSISARNVLYIGVKAAPNFRYQDIRRFARRSLMIAAREIEETEHITLTLHGPGYGLDEREAFESELAGVMEAVREGIAPDELKRISFVEVNHKRAQRLEKILEEFLSGKTIDRRQSPPDQARSVGYDSEGKPHIFVAMPFKDEFDDVYYLGIEDAVHSVDSDLLCERIDNKEFVGEIDKEIKDRIESASLVIADMTNANPNVYLEVGYAWGKDVPTLLLTQDTDHLKFDVQNHNSIIYDRNTIYELRDELENTIEELSLSHGY